MTALKIDIRNEIITRLKEVVVLMKSDDRDYSIKGEEFVDALGNAYALYSAALLTGYQRKEKAREVFIFKTSDLLPVFVTELNRLFSELGIQDES